MAVINRSDLEAGNRLPVAPTKEVPFAPLGGDVVLHGLMLEQRFANSAWLLEGQRPRDGESAGEALARTSGGLVARVLSQSVKGADGVALLTLAEWEALAISHGDETFALANDVFALSGDAPLVAAKN